MTQTYQKMAESTLRTWIGGQMKRTQYDGARDKKLSLKTFIGDPEYIKLVHKIVDFNTMIHP